MSDETNEVVLEPVPIEPGSPATGLARDDFPWLAVVQTTLASAVGTFLVIPFSLDLLRQSKDMPFSADFLPVVLAAGAAFEVMLTFPLVVLGLGLGRSMGLIWPPLDGWDDGPDAPVRRRRALVLAVVLGVVAAGLIVGLGYAMRGVMPGDSKVVMPNWWKSLLASFGAGIREEVWLRLGFMTLFVWLGWKIGRGARPGPTAVWTGNLLANLIFGAMHLPQAAGLIGLNAGVLAFVMIGNGVPGLIFGWLYWRKGLLAAMTAHAVTDVVLKVILAPLLG